MDALKKSEIETIVTDCLRETGDLSGSLDETTIAGLSDVHFADLYRCIKDTLEKRNYSADFKESDLEDKENTGQLRSDIVDFIRRNHSW